MTAYAPSRAGIGPRLQCKPTIWCSNPPIPSEIDPTPFHHTSSSQRSQSLHDTIHLRRLGVTSSLSCAIHINTCHDLHQRIVLHAGYVGESEHVRRRSGAERTAFGLRRTNKSVRHRVLHPSYSNASMRRAAEAHCALRSLSLQRMSADQNLVRNARRR